MQKLLYKVELCGVKVKTKKIKGHLILRKPSIPHSSTVNVQFMYKQVLTCMQFKHSLSFSLQFDDILEFGWQEVNQGTRNLIQKNVS